METKPYSTQVPGWNYQAELALISSIPTFGIANTSREGLFQLSLKFAACIRLLQFSRVERVTYKYFDTPSLSTVI